MARIVFPSLLAGNERAFCVNDIDPRGLWNQWYNNPAEYVCAHLGWFNTYGDGMVQHSPEYLCPISMWNDVLTSLAAHILGGCEDVLPHVYDHETVLPEHAEFYKSLRYQQDVPRWFNRRTCESSRSASKAELRAWERVPHWVDGTTANAVRLYLAKGNITHSVLKTAWVVAAFSSFQQPDMFWPGYLEPMSRRLPYGHEVALRALSHAHDLCFAREFARRCIENVKSNAARNGGKTVTDYMDSLKQAA